MARMRRDTGSAAMAHARRGCRVDNSDRSVRHAWSCHCRAAIVIACVRWARQRAWSLCETSSRLSLLRTEAEGSNEDEGRMHMSICALEQHRVRRAH